VKKVTISEELILVVNVVDYILDVFRSSFSLAGGGTLACCFGYS